MTDARLMEADCIHGVVWYSCEDCCAYLGEELRELEPQEGDEDPGDWP